MPNNKPFGIIIASLGLLCSGGTAIAQTNLSTFTMPAAPLPGLLNDWLREQNSGFSTWDIGGQVRARYEDKAYFAVPNQKHVDFQHTGDSENAYELMRERVHVGWTPWDWIEVYGEMQDSTSFGDDRQPSPDNDHYSLRQAWVALGNPQEFPIVAKVGRQELIYGDQRFIGVADWLNFGRSYDAAKVRYQTSSFWVDAFVSQPVLPDLRGFDTSDSHDKFSGLYASTRTLIPVQESQFYVLARNTDGHPAYEAAEKPVQYPLASPRDIYTVGARVRSLPGAVKGWDYNVEGAYQFGRFEASTATPSMTQEAFAVHAAGGYTWKNMAMSPRAGLEYNYGSGDSNAKDGHHGTFDNLFPSQHGLYGIMDFFSLQNMQDVHGSFSVKPAKPLTLSIDGYAYWLATTGDFFYQSNGGARPTGGFYGINPSYSSSLGEELDLTATWMMTSFASVQGGFAHFFAGDYIKESLATHGGRADADYVYAQLSFNF